MNKLDSVNLKIFTKKVFFFILTMFIISVLTFLLVKMQPGDPATNYLRALHIGINDETLAQARQILNLDKPIHEQYGAWLINALKGNLGDSYIYNKPVTAVIWDATIPTLKLGLFSFISLVFLSLMIGILGALYHGRAVDYIMQGISYVCVSIPTFWLGYMLIILFTIILKLLPASGHGGIEYYILPAFCLMVPIVGQTGLFIRKNLIEEMKKPHVENAVMRGVMKKYVITNHLMKNIVIPVITIFSSNIMYLISGSILIEEVFAWPGLGRMFVAAVKTGDLPLIQGSLLLFGIMAIILNSGTQKLVYQLDPHMRLRRKKYA